MKSSVTILLTGCGSPGAHGIIQSLRREPSLRPRMIGVDSSEQAVGRSFVDKFERVPLASDDAYVARMLQICERESVDIILPMVTRELVPLALASQKFMNLGTIVATSTPASLMAANHKGTLLSRLTHHKIPVPEYACVKTAHDLLGAITDLGYPSRPVCFKPVYGDGSRGFHVLDESVSRVKNLFEARPNSANISLSELRSTLEGVTEIPEVLVMEFLTGNEYSVDLLVDDGRVLVAIPRLREHTVEGITTKGTIVFAPDVIDYATRVAEALCLHGNVGVQVRRNEKGEPRILEVNPRLQGTTVHTTAAGVNLPYLGVKLHLGQPIFASELQVRWGTRMARYWREVFSSPDGTHYTL